MTKSMENNSKFINILLDELIQSDHLLKLVKSEAFSFSLADIAVATNPKSHGFHFIKSEYFWNIFKAKITENNLSNLIVLIDSKIQNLVMTESRISSCIVTTNFELSMAKASKIFYEHKFTSINQHLDGRLSGTAKIHPSSLVSPQAFIGEYVEIGEGVEIMPGATIGAYTSIGDFSKIFPRVCIYTHVKIGKNCRIHSGTVIGSDGFGYVFDQGQHQKIWHIGSVIINNHVEIGANSCVDAGTFVPTMISDHCIIDNLVQVAHNTQLGKGVVICGQAGTAGSCIIGDYTVLGGRAAIGPHCELGKYTKVAGGGMVTKSWGDSVELAGHPARPMKEWLRNLALINRLDKKSKKDN